MNYNEYKAKISELNSLFCVPRYERVIGNLLGDLSYSYYAEKKSLWKVLAARGRAEKKGSWKVFASRDRANPIEIKSFSTEDELYDWLYDEYSKRYFGKIYCMDFFIDLRQEWMLELLSRDSNPNVIKDFISCSNSFSYENLMKSDDARERVFAEVFSFDTYHMPYYILRALYNWIKCDESNRIKQFELAVLQSLSGDSRDFYIGFTVIETYLCDRNISKKHNEYYFDIDIVKVVDTFKKKYQELREEMVDSVVKLSETYSVDIWESIEKDEKRNSKMYNFSLLNCDNPMDLFN